ncbi:ribosome maturation factor RimM [Patulibacter minatonensis]|uniref:ribosome maturation factor RimM n=1 Tax=Patulibacter minatonensis TaxID=298163 RepID=UPI0004BC3B3A|nr:ribosome maturation factor RimM [Patulibacter minatonensis]
MAADRQDGPDADGAPVDSGVPADAGTPTTAAGPGAPVARQMHQLGRIGKAHSLDGSFAVTRPKGEHLTVGTVLTVGGVEREIVRRSGTDAKPILRLTGIDGIDAAEALRGTDLLVPRDTLPALPDDEFWPDDLVGLPVRAATGQDVGEVAEVLVMPSVDVLRVRWAPEHGRPDLLVPLHRDAVPVFDVASRDVVIDLAFLDEDPPGDAAGEPSGPTTPEEG